VASKTQIRSLVGKDSKMAGKGPLRDSYHNRLWQLSLPFAAYLPKLSTTAGNCSSTRRSARQSPTGFKRGFRDTRYSRDAGSASSESAQDVAELPLDTGL